METNFLIIGDLNGRRINSFIECLNNLGFRNYKVITWNELLLDVNIFRKNLKENTIIKIEPPEKDMNIYSGFLKLGSSKGEVSKKDIEKIDFSTCEIVAPAQWYEGFKILLSHMENIFLNEKHKNIFLMNDFKEILVMMDKGKTYEILEEKMKDYDFYLPKKIDTPKNYREFREVYGNKITKCFIKLRYGSGGTGIIAYKNNPKLLEESIFTSLNFENKDGKQIFYSNNKVNYFEDKDKIKNLIDWVLLNGAHVESWIPKASYEGYAFDTRVFVINKNSEYLISRLSKTPITNLHLRNKRMESRDIISEEHINIISKAAEDVMKVFHNSLYAGIDVVCSKGYRPYIIDVNPFGDLFHNLLGTDKNTHYLEIKKAIEILGGKD